MHFVQRFTKSADGKELTIDSMPDDPTTLKHPVRTTRKWLWVYGQQPLEFDCEENPVCIRHEGEGTALSTVVCNARNR
ncbi:MAG: hypothetical protein ACREUG_00535 [Steroidobacteraceae bacterium]